MTARVRLPGVLLLCLLLPLLSPMRASAVDPFIVSGSARVDFLYFRDTPPGVLGIEPGASNLDAWLEARAFYWLLEGGGRLRIHQSKKIQDDESMEEIDRRYIALVHPDGEVRLGHYYVTFGNGLVLRTLEQRFVTLNRIDRAFNLDRSLDGVKLHGDLDLVRGTVIKGKPRSQVLSGTGGATEIDRSDDLQGGELVLVPVPSLELAGVYVEAELHEASRTTLEDLVSIWGRWRTSDLSAMFEYAEIRPRDDLVPAGYGRYAGVNGAYGPVGWVLEVKDYRHFFFPYHQPPTLVRTHESVLLNRATHLVLPDDEQGFQAEVIYAPGLFTTFLANVAASEGGETEGREFREIYLEYRTEGDGAGTRLGLDWSRDIVRGVQNRWTAAWEVELFLSDRNSLVLDLEGQDVERRSHTYTNQLAQISFARADAFTATLTAERTTRRFLEKTNWLFAAVDLKVSQRLDLTLGYGTRPEGIVCSGGFCFEAPAFDGAEVRLLGRF